MLFKKYTLTEFQPILIGVLIGIVMVASNIFEFETLHTSLRIALSLTYIVIGIAQLWILYTLFSKPKKQTRGVTFWLLVVSLLAFGISLPLFGVINLTHFLN